jgi:crotonobetainyl-CoA:carnitine CoA-transferase CaiB-like acyl-CoA transferase
MLMTLTASEFAERREPSHPSGRQLVTLSRTPSKMAARPPEFGEQTDEVLTEFGFNASEIATLRQDKVV